MDNKKLKQRFYDEVLNPLFGKHCQWWIYGVEMEKYLISTPLTNIVKCLNITLHRTLHYKPFAKISNLAKFKNCTHKKKKKLSKEQFFSFYTVITVSKETNPIDTISFIFLLSILKRKENI